MATSFGQGRSFTTKQLSCFNFELKVFNPDSLHTYHWYIDTVAFDTAGTDSINYTYADNDTLNWCLHTIDTSGESFIYCDSVIADSTIPQIVIGKNQPAEFCFGRSVSIEPTETYENVLWSTGETYFNIEVFETGTYQLTVFKGDTTCAVNSNSIDITVTQNYFPTLSISDSSVVCLGANLGLIENYESIYYDWNTGENTNSISIDSSGIYFCEIWDTNYCMATTDTIYLSAEEPSSANICKVSFIDSIEKLNISWEVLNRSNISAYNIYKYKESNNSLIYLDQVSYNNAGNYIDQSSSPKELNHQYVITTIDTCGNESDERNIAENIHLDVHLNSDSAILSWNTPSQIDSATYVIYGGSDSLNMDSIIRTNRNMQSFFDTSFTYYQIQLINNNTCGPTYSNWKFNGKVKEQEEVDQADNIIEWQTKNFNVYPNPNKGQFHIEMEYDGWKTISIFNIDGRLMRQELTQNKGLNIDANNWPKGNYVIEISNQNNTISKTISIQ